jgi:hypothetical protein
MHNVCVFLTRRLISRTWFTPFASDLSLFTEDAASKLIAGGCLLHWRASPLIPPVGPAALGVMPSELMEEETHA